MSETKCYYCKSSKVNRVRKLSKNWVYRCSRCGLGFQNPLPSEKEIRNYYLSSIYPEVWGKHTESFGKMKKATYKWIFSHLPWGGGEKLLDIGTGYGFCLSEAGKKNYEATGVEPSEKLAKIAEKTGNTKVVRGFFEDSKFPPDSFKVVSIFDTLEHVRKPFEFLKKAINLVKPKGYLVISTPDYGSLSSRFLERFWFHLKDEHYFYFSGEFLGKFFENEGFRIIEAVPQKRPLSLAYLENHFRIYPIPIFSPILHKLILWLPRKIKSKIFSIYDGNLFLIAQKSS